LNLLLFVLLLGCAALGCGQKHDLAPAGGKVTLDGRPLSGGGVVFAPIARGNAAEAGKPSYGDIQPDGTFVLGTYDESDGAVIGKHSATIYGGRNPKKGGSTPAAGDKPPFSQLNLVDRQFEVIAGKDNQFHIELTMPLVRKFGQLDD